MGIFSADASFLRSDRSRPSWDLSGLSWSISNPRDSANENVQQFQTLKHSNVLAAPCTGKKAEIPCRNTSGSLTPFPIFEGVLWVFSLPTQASCGASARGWPRKHSNVLAARCTGKKAEIPCQNTSGSLTPQPWFGERLKDSGKAGLPLETLLSLRKV